MTVKLLNIQSKLDLIVQILMQEGIYSPELDFLVKEMRYREKHQGGTGYPESKRISTVYPYGGHDVHMQFLECRWEAADTPYRIIYLGDKDGNRVWANHMNAFEFEVGAWYKFSIASDDRIMIIKKASPP